MEGSAVIRPASAIVRKHQINQSFKCRCPLTWINEPDQEFHVAFWSGEGRTDQTANSITQLKSIIQHIHYHLAVDGGITNHTLTTPHLLATSLKLRFDQCNDCPC